MKNLLNSLVLAILFLAIASCSTDNLNNTSQNSFDKETSFDTRFINESDAAVSVIVYDLNGKVTESSKEVSPGEAFNFNDIASGETTFRIITENSCVKLILTKK